MVSLYHIIVFAASIAVSWQIFCDYGVEYKLECPEDSLITGIRTTSEILSANSTPVCSKLARHVLPDDKYSYYYYKKPSYHNDKTFVGNLEHLYIFPKVWCDDHHYAMKSLEFCVFEGQIPAIGANCRRLKHIGPYKKSYRVVRDIHNSEIKCGVKGLLNGIRYERRIDGSLVAIANCSTLVKAKEDAAARQEIVAAINSPNKGYCGNGQLVEVACPDGYVVTGVKSSSKIFSPDVKPVCSKKAHKLSSGFEVESTQYVFESDPHPKVSCSCSDPIVLKFDICFENSVVKAIKTHCRRFIESGIAQSTTHQYNQYDNTSAMKCPKGSFLQDLWTDQGWFRWSSNGTDVTIQATCVAIEE